MSILKFFNNFSLKRKSKKNKTRGGKKKKKETAKKKSAERPPESSRERLALLKKKLYDAQDTYKVIENEIGYLDRQLQYTNDPKARKSIMSQIKEKEIPDKNAHEDLLQAKMEYESVARRRP
jgi:hypothetical protein